MLDLTAPERDVLTALAASRVTVSAVTLAAGLYNPGGGHDVRFDRGDPVGFVTMVIESLGERGLIKYRLRDHGGAFPGDIPLDIRLTPDGWVEAGYPITTGVVGTASRHMIPPRHPGDRTDYRTHPHTTTGEHPVERLSFGEHMARYPTHLFHLNGGPFVGDDMTRTYTKVTADMEAAAILYRASHPTAGYAEVAENIGIPERTAKYILTTRVRERGLIVNEDAESLKTRMLRVITEFGPLEDVFALRTMLATGEDPHNITHCLNSLAREGSVTFKTRQRGSTTRYENIRARTKSEKTKDAERKAIHAPTSTDMADASAATAATNGETMAIEPHIEEPTPTVDSSAPDLPGEDILTTPVEEPTSPVLGEVNDWPVLSGLIRAERDRMDGESKVAVYINAAQSLADLGDKEEADRLLAKAASVAPAAPTDIEREYIAFATSVVRKGEGLPKP